MKVLRLCSVFEPPPQGLGQSSRRFDPIGGMQNHTGELTRALGARGVEQTVVTTRLPGASRRQEFAQGAQSIRLGWNIRRLRQLYGVAALPFMRHLGSSADIVHVHLGEDLAIIPLGFLAARFNKKPIVVTIHCSPKHTVVPTDMRSALINKIGGRIEEWGERYTAIISITWRLANKLVESGVPANKVHIIPSGVRSRLFEEPRQDPLPNLARPRVGFAGRLTRVKGIFDLLDAFELLTHDANLVYVGDGPDRRALEHEIANRRLGERVKVTGFVTHDLIPAYLQNIDVLTLPSHYEELGSILVEGLQAGLPLVGTRTGGIPEVIDEGRTGLLVPTHTPKQLAEALDTLLWNANLRMTMGRAALAQAPLYEWTHLADRVHGVYESVLRSEPVPA